MVTYTTVLPGDPAPMFQQRTSTNPAYAFHSVGGRYVVLCFYVSKQHPNGAAALAAVRAHPDLFDDNFASFFGVSIDPQDKSTGRVKDQYPGYRHLWDFDGAVSRLYGSIPIGTTPGKGPLAVRQAWFVLDPTLRVQKLIPFAADNCNAEALISYLRSLPPPGQFAGVELQAPVLVLPNVFEPAFCKRLIDLYEMQGGEESGFVRDKDGKTVRVNDHGHKRRKDATINDDKLRQACQALVNRRVVPEIKKIHQFEVTRMERYIVACYAAEDKAHFAPHRDNTTSGTAHRRFALSIVLNADYEGGEVHFPEYGKRLFKPPAGGAVVFSCSLLHAVRPVTKGKRYVFLPFLYDDAAAKIREANNPNLSDEIGTYISASPPRSN